MERGTSPQISKEDRDQYLVSDVNPTQSIINTYSGTPSYISYTSCSTAGQPSNAKNASPKAMEQYSLPNEQPWHYFVDSLVTRIDQEDPIMASGMSPIAHPGQSDTDFSARVEVIVSMETASLQKLYLPPLGTDFERIGKLSDSPQLCFPFRKDVLIPEPFSPRSESAYSPQPFEFDSLDTASFISAPSSPRSGSRPILDPLGEELHCLTIGSETYGGEELTASQQQMEASTGSTTAESSIVTYMGTPSILYSHSIIAPTPFQLIDTEVRRLIWKHTDRNVLGLAGEPPSSYFRVARRLLGMCGRFREVSTGPRLELSTQVSSRNINSIIQIILQDIAEIWYQPAMDMETSSKCSEITAESIQKLFVDLQWAVGRSLSNSYAERASDRQTESPTFPSATIYSQPREYGHLAYCVSCSHLDWAAFQLTL